MPLHLLPKKSWNVYNADNIERVRRDEAAAEAAEQAKEERMQEADAARRLAILRGEDPPALPDDYERPLDPAAGALVKARDRDRFPGEKRKRKRAGEDDTDFEIRVARDRVAAVVEPRRGSEAPWELAGLMDPAEQKGMVNRPSREEEAAEKQRAAQRAANPVLKDALAIKEDPWFLKAAKPGDTVDEPGRDAWGNEDPGRRARDAVRLDKNDPLAMMKRGAAKVRQVEKERKRESEERERELKALRREERRREKKRRREDRPRDDTGELEGFSLDAPTKLDDRRPGETRHRSRHRHTEMDRERHHERDRDGRRRQHKGDRPRDPSRSNGDSDRRGDRGGHEMSHRPRSRDGRDRDRSQR